MTLSIAATLPMLVAGPPRREPPRHERAPRWPGLSARRWSASASTASSPIPSRCARSSRSTCWAAASSCCSASSRARARRPDCRRSRAAGDGHHRHRRRLLGHGARGRAAAAAVRGDRPRDAEPRCAGRNRPTTEPMPMTAMALALATTAGGFLLVAGDHPAGRSACCCRCCSAGASRTHRAGASCRSDLAVARAIAIEIWRTGQPLVYIARRLDAAARHRAARRRIFGRHAGDGGAGDLGGRRCFARANFATPRELRKSARRWSSGPCCRASGRR